MNTTFKVWPALWLIAEALVWGPEWDMWEYFGYRWHFGLPYDTMGMGLFSADNKWRYHFLDHFDNVYNCEAWHTYGFEWTSEYARSVQSSTA